MKTAIVWFKTDLRLEIMKPFKTIAQSETVLPVYCFDDSDCHHNYGLIKR
jgi:deoxyribodipyrimidine photolyase